MSRTGLFLLGCWMLNLVGGEPEADWHQETGYRWRKLSVPAGKGIGFTRLSGSATGVLFTNQLTDVEGAMNRVLYNGSGVAVGDYDRDGRPDLYFCGLNRTNALYRNLGDWKFEEVTQQLGVGMAGQFSRGAVFVDLDGDGWEDLLVSTLAHGVRYFHNRGGGVMEDRTEAAGISSDSGSTTLALADVDGNGTLDLYVTNYRSTDIRDQGEVTLNVVGNTVRPPPEYVGRLEVLEGALYEYGQPDQLFLNEGSGRLRLASWTGGIFQDENGKALVQPPRDWGLTATFRDLDGNGLPDLYVCNDYWTPDRMWINQGGGKFRAVAGLALRSTSASSMGLDIADYDRDGDPDLFVLDMLSRDSRLRLRQKTAQMPRPSEIGVTDDRPQVMRNTLLENLGDGTFREAAWYAGIPASDWSWSTVFMDVDLDGFEDLLVSAGHFKDVQDMDVNMLIKVRQRPRDASLAPEERRRRFTQELLEHHRLYPRLDMPVVAFHNQGDGTFVETTAEWGTEEPGVHHSVAYGDLDGDGDLDLVTNNLETNAGLYRNEASGARVAVRLKGLAPNTAGVGAKVILHGGPVPEQSQEVVVGGRYLAGCDPQLVFAAGPGASGLRLEVYWRSGRHSIVDGVQPNALYEIDEAGAGLARGAATERSTLIPLLVPKPVPLFEEVTDRLKASHREEAFDDFVLQPLLPLKRSQAGPGVAWFDLNGDGHDDLVMGDGKGGTVRVWLGNGQGQFKPVVAGAGWVAPDDVTAVLGWYPRAGDRGLLFGVSGYEAPGEAAVMQGIWARDRLEITVALTNVPVVVGPLALGDLEGDGDLDLFVGSGSLPGRYPEAGGSRIYRREQGRWVEDAENGKVLQGVGIVNGAVWSDLDGDGLPELALACEWGPVRVFENRGGSLRECTGEWGLAEHTGLWRGVTAGDIDGDGQLDLVAANWGLNSSFRASYTRPLRWLFGDLQGIGRNELVETGYSETGAVVPDRDFNAYAASIPALYERYRSFRQFSQTTVAEMLGQDLAIMHEVKANTLATTAFLNRARRFEAKALPRPAQLAPAFGVVVADVNLDGREDVFLSQNFFAVRPDLARQDSGRGLWMTGEDGGGWSSLSPEASGVRVYGEQRGAAVADFDEDGRLDLAVGQNGAEAKIYQGWVAAGLRVRLAGTPENPDGVGAVIQLGNGSIWGPARPILGGSGYWSQTGLISILPRVASGARLRVRWPGGVEQLVEVPVDCREITVRLSDR